MHRHRRIVTSGAVAGVGVAILVVTLTLSAPSLVPWEHYACVPGAIVATEYNWTPEVLMNSPFGGESRVTFHDPLGFGNEPAQNGVTTVDFHMLEWNLSVVGRTLTLGAGPSVVSCPTYEVTSSLNVPPWQPSGGCHGCEIQGYGTVDDTAEPTQFNLSETQGIGVTSVVFHNGFVLQNDGSVSTCGGPFRQISVNSTSLAFQVPFSTPHGSLIFNETVYTAFGYPSGSYWANFTYTFAPDFGTWRVDNLSLGPYAFGGGLAFSFAPCTK